MKAAVLRSLNTPLEIDDIERELKRMKKLSIARERPYFAKASKGSFFAPLRLSEERTGWDSNPR